jgi:hypothetical protein
MTRETAPQILNTNFLRLISLFSEFGSAPTENFQYLTLDVGHEDATCIKLTIEHIYYRAL